MDRSEGGPAKLADAGLIWSLGAGVNASAPEIVAGAILFASALTMDVGFAGAAPGSSKRFSRTGSRITVSAVEGDSLSARPYNR